MAADSQVPRHVAIIMDGNGRWAEARGLDRVEGHRAGARSVREIVRAAGALGVEYLTLYSFSTENWRRPKVEVAALMALLEEYLRDELGELQHNRVRLDAIGQIDRLPLRVRGPLEAVRFATRNNDGLRLILALSYGGRADLVEACQRIATQVQRRGLKVGDIDESTVEAALSTAGVPDPDLLIRTSGEKRLSNFLLWQAAYAEIYLTDTSWPDFGREHLEEAFRSFAQRNRRFGQTDAQVSGG